MNVSFKAPVIKPYLASVIACSLSSFITLRIRKVSLLRIAMISLPLGSVEMKFSISLSFSSNLIDRKRVEYLWRMSSF